MGTGKRKRRFLAHQERLNKEKAEREMTYAGRKKEMEKMGIEPPPAPPAPEPEPEPMPEPEPVAEEEVEAEEEPKKEMSEAEEEKETEPLPIVNKTVDELPEE